MNPMFWIYARHYKKLLFENPNSQEAIDMAVKSGKVRELWEWQNREGNRQMKVELPEKINLKRSYDDPPVVKIIISVSKKIDEIIDYLARKEEGE